MGGNLFGIGFGELLFLAVLALLIFGPKRIPEIGRSIGRFLKQVRQATSGIDQEVRQWMDMGDVQEVLTGERPPARPGATAPGAPPFPPRASGESGPAEKIDQAPPSLPG